jgi:hypothetical protein
MKAGVRATPIVLSIAFLTVAAAGAWSAHSVILPFTSQNIESEFGPLPEWTAAPGYGDVVEPTDTEEPAEPVEIRPIIQRGIIADPFGDGERSEYALNAVDGDPSTYWYTYTYATANFGGLKPGVGYVIRLEQAARVSGVRIYANGSGGLVEIRLTDESDPSGGEMVGRGELGTEVEIPLLHALETDTLTLWFTELPQLPDGRFRLELREVLVH